MTFSLHAHAKKGPPAVEIGGKSGGSADEEVDKKEEGEKKEEKAEGGEEEKKDEEKKDEEKKDDEEKKADEVPAAPLFAGNIISTYAQNSTKGLFSFQPYLYYTRLYGFYDTEGHIDPKLNVHQFVMESQTSYGLTDFVDVSLDVTAYEIWNDGHHTNALGDAALYFGFQLISELEDNFISNLRFLVGEIFPSGVFNNLDATFSGGDAIGTGSYTTFLGLIANKVCANTPHPFMITLDLYLSYFTVADVEGLNLFIMSDPFLEGSITPGLAFATDLAFEYKLNPAWSIAVDFYYQHQNRSYFLDRNTDIFVTLPDSTLFSIAPAIGYVLNEKRSFLIGGWFTVTGRNAPAFDSLVATIYFGF